MFTILEPYPLCAAMMHTPMDEQAPLAPVKLIRERGNRFDILYWEVVRCPFCRNTHRHGAQGKYPSDPREYLGGRIAHCNTSEFRRYLHDGFCGEYRLIGIEGKPTKAELDEHFPLVRRPLPPGRMPFSREIKDEVWAKTGGYCAYCGVTLHPFTTFTIDHIVAVSVGGGNEIDNLLPCCQTCNSAKHAMSLDRFRERQGVKTFWFETHT